MVDVPGMRSRERQCGESKLCGNHQAGEKHQRCNLHVGDACLPVVQVKDRLDRVEARGKGDDTGDL